MEIRRTERIKAKPSEGGMDAHSVEEEVKLTVLSGQMCSLVGRKLHRQEEKLKN